MAKQGEVVCAVLIGNAESEGKAREFATKSSTCPYVATVTSAGRLVVGVFAMPADKRWWIEVPQDRPELLGLEKVAVFVTDRIEATSLWTRGDVRPDQKIAPCGSDCGTCPELCERCGGCPATITSASKM